MVQILITTFFSAASLGAVAVIVSSVADGFGDIRTALRLSAPLPSLPSARIRVGRIVTMRGLATAPAVVQPRRAAA